MEAETKWIKSKPGIKKVIFSLNLDIQKVTQWGNISHEYLYTYVNIYANSVCRSCDNTVLTVQQPHMGSNYK